MPDTITGATLVYSAGSVTEAVDDILAQAKGEKEAVPAPAAEEEPVAAPEAEPVQEQTALIPETSAVTDAEAESDTMAKPEAEQVVETDGSRLMRERPDTNAAAEQAAEPVAVAETEPEPDQTLVEKDGSRFMRERPVIRDTNAERFMRKRVL
jgi:hypothetical protein